MDQKYNEFEKQRKLKEQEFLEYVREVCAACWHCSKIDFKGNLIRLNERWDDYICEDCKEE